jgi:Zn-dependent M28 family amino/carboxypeptidase
MTTRSAVVAVVAAAACGAGPRETTPFDGDAALAYVQEQVAFGPRVPNTDGHRRTGDWIEAKLRGAADSVEVQSWTHVTGQGDSLTMRNFIGRFRPDATERVLLLAHWDTRPRADKEPNLGRQQQPIPGANDGASGVAVLLGVADVLRATAPAFGVDLLFVDGEDWGTDFSGPDALIGSRYYARQLPRDRHPLFAVLFDMVGDADLEFQPEANSVTGAPEVVTRVWNVARDLGYARVFRSDRQVSLTDDHIPLLEAGVRAIDVIDFEYGPNNRYWHTLEDTPDKVSARSLKIVGDVAVKLVM